MDNQNTFSDYYSRLFNRFWKDFVAWPRDNILVAGIAAIAPPLVLYLYSPDKVPDWELLKATVRVYLGFFGLYSAVHLVRVPWVLDRERSRVIATVEAEKTKLLNEKRTFDESQPKIVLREPNARHIQRVALSDGRSVIHDVLFVKVRFVNRPAKHTESSVAHQVGAKVKFFDEDGRLILEMDGRWDDKDQPSERPFTQTKRDLLLAEFNFEEEHNLDIGFWDSAAKEFVAFNNDNYNYQTMKKPEHILQGNRFKAEIRLVGVHIDNTYTVEFSANDREVRIIDETNGQPPSLKPRAVR